MQTEGIEDVGKMAVNQLGGGWFKVQGTSETVDRNWMTSCAFDYGLFDQPDAQFLHECNFCLLIYLATAHLFGTARYFCDRSSVCACILKQDACSKVMER